MTDKTIYTRDGVWAYAMCGDTWVRDVTHRPTGRTMPGRASLPTIRRRAASGELLADLDAREGA